MKRFISAILAIICMLLTPAAAHALYLPPSDLTVVVNYGDTPLSDINIALCRVADASEENGIVVYQGVPAFAGIGADFAALAMSQSAAPDPFLNIFNANTQIAAATKCTGSDGRMVFSDLAAGLYLVTQINAESGKYRITPFLAAVPAHNATGGGRNHHVIARPKAEPIKPYGESISISVYIIWKGTANPPGGVSVQLYRDGIAYGNPVLLTCDGFWKYTWHHLDANDIWTVDEPSVPAGYDKSLSGDAGSGFIITNTKRSGDPAPTWPISSNPAGGGSYGSSPKTDDSSNMRLWTLLVLAASAGLFAVILTLTHTLKKKRSRRLKEAA